MELQNTSIIITGAASGMGAATARWLSKCGARVALLDLNEAAAKKIAAEIHGVAVQCDVADAQSVEAALQKSEQAIGPARVCVNCAGVVHARRMVSQQGPMPLDEFKKIIDINLIGTFNVMRMAANAMIPLAPIGDSGERGVIINTASVAAFEGQIGQTAYSASKGAIVSLTLPAARELAQFGIRVNAIAPGLVKGVALAASEPRWRSENLRSLCKVIENIMINGAVLRLDGALRMGAK